MSRVLISVLLIQKPLNDVCNNPIVVLLILTNQILHCNVFSLHLFLCLVADIDVANQFLFTRLFSKNFLILM